MTAGSDGSNLYTPNQNFKADPPPKIYSLGVSLSLIFFQEMKQLWNAQNPPEFSGGIVTDNSNQSSLKVKLEGSGTEVNAEYNIFGEKILKGATVLLLVTYPQSAGMKSIVRKYRVISWRQTGAFAPDKSLYVV